MPRDILSLLGAKTEAQRYELKKFILLSGCYFLGIFSFSIIKPLKQSIFLNIIGPTYQPSTRFLGLAILPLVMAFYSKIVDKFRRHQVVIFFLGAYAIGGLIFSYLFWHPAYGLSNTTKDPWRLVPWFFYVFGDFYQIFIVGSFWAFSNSITDTKNAKKNYGSMVAVSKVAGITSPLLCGLALSTYSSNIITPILISITSILLLLAAITIYYLKKSIPGQYLHGYEAVYQLEKEKAKKNGKETGILEGIRLMIAQPYVFGIFSLIYCYEVISAIMDYQMLVLADLHYAGDFTEVSKFLFNYTAGFQGIGLLFAVFGSRIFLQIFDVKACLIISPVITAGLLIIVFMYPSLYTITIFMVVLRALNYGFNMPVKEILYIPTVKDIKFKSKAWIDSFGKTISKSTGSGYNLLTARLTPLARLTVGSQLALGVTIIWASLAILVGRRYKKAVDHNEAIGDSSNLNKA